MNKYFRHFMMVGFSLGVLYGLGLVVYSFYIASGLPGMSEMISQLAIVFITGISFSIFSLFIWLLCFGVEKLYLKLNNQTHHP